MKFETRYKYGFKLSSSTSKDLCYSAMDEV